MDELFGDIDGVGLVYALFFFLQLLLINTEPAVVNIHFGLILIVFCIFEFFDVLSLEL